MRVMRRFLPVAAATARAWRGAVMARRSLATDVTSQVAEALEFTAKDLGWAKGAHCVICTGQYFTHGRDDDDSDADTNSFGDAVDFDRLVVCALEGDVRERYVVHQLADIVLPSDAHPSQVIENYLLLAGAVSVSPGECDFIGGGPWKYGFFRETSYHVFSDAEVVSQVVVRDGAPAFALSSWPRSGVGSSASGSEEADTDERRIVPFSSVRDVRVTLSDDWSSRRLFFVTSKGEEVDILTDSFEGDVIGAAGGHNLDAAAMITTEWLVKAAGGFVLELRRAGLAPRLVLPRVLTERNASVAARNRMWREHLERREKREKKCESHA